MKIRTKLFEISIAVVAVIVITGCGGMVRPISSSGYSEPPRTYHGPPSSAGSGEQFTYRGELSEFDVLGITRGAETSDREIEQALASAKRVRLHSGNSIMLIQSGAIFPDGPMVSELSKHFRIVPFSGVPPESRAAERGLFERSDTETFSRSLRLTAARGGNDLILCYWGVLESENAKLATKTVSWVPVMNWVLPDEREHMRIRLKLALIDVRTGDWAVFSPKPVEDSAVSRSPRRNVADQKLVESLKLQAYTTGAKDLIRQYSEIAVAD